ncbi:MAG: hypothetical protein A2X94_08190 [Bdellovibrionales bacterium GWB1_55_8]|nr:MAG: hypothetical protein A2X94_08190 [Bdellovibrionales bacterium GWB1_55_8]
MNGSIAPHLWRGEWISESELKSRVSGLSGLIGETVGTPLDLRALIDACAALSKTLDSGTETRKLTDILQAGGGVTEAEVAETISGIADFLRRENLELKLRRELGSADPFHLARVEYSRHLFECWAPLGCLVHLAPTNSPSVGFLSVIEGLLAGNVNFLKIGGDDTLFTPTLLRMLVDSDSAGMLRDYIYCARISSRTEEGRDLLKQILANADGVAAWGGEAGIEGARKLTPSSARFVDWGPKISFVYVARERLEDQQLIEKIARECCAIEQQACSSPQCVYVETEDRSELRRFGERLARVMDLESPKVAPVEPSIAEQAEITSVTELCRLESCLDFTQVMEAKDGAWRILIEFASGLRASPLYRTVWLKPLPKNKIISALRPLRAYLQTAALSCDASRASELGGLLLRAGVLRITESGKMLDGYTGEPHDGVYALQRYCRGVSFQSDGSLKGISNFADLETGAQPQTANVGPILTKAMFQNADVDPRFSELFFKSGGSSGDPKLSVFTYDDYHRQMQLAAEGLYAAGLDPAADRCMNLFFAGGLYGGFVSFFTILEHLGTVQFPMGAHVDLKMVARTIVEHRVNVLLGMPSYLIQLFRENEELFRTYRGVEKVFYGGEHFNAVQKRYFMDAFGINLIKSATYGSVDAGPLGYQCRHSEGGVHHLHGRLHRLEILGLDNDQPVEGATAGRLIFTSLVRKGQSLTRYEIGDVGRWITGDCACGRRSPRFELLGRHGDVFRIGATYYSYQKFLKILADHRDYGEELQIRLKGSGIRGLEKLELSVLRDRGLTAEMVRGLLLAEYKDLDESVSQDGILEFEVKLITPEQFEKTAGSGKLRHIIDERDEEDRSRG